MFRELYRSRAPDPARPGGLGPDEATVREIYGAVGREAIVTGASDDTRMAEVRKRMLAAVR